jgi:hypothetical protein
MHITGEILLNDGSSVVLFHLFSQLTFSQLGLLETDGSDESPFDLMGAVWLFIKMAAWLFGRWYFLWWWLNLAAIYF